MNAITVDPLRPHLFATGSTDPIGERLRRKAALTPGCWAHAPG